MRSIFKLLDIIFIFLGLPYLYVIALDLIHHRTSALHDALTIVMYLLITFANYRDKWNAKEKKGIITYPLLVMILLYTYFSLEIAVIGGLLTFVLMLLKRISAIFVSGALLALWAFLWIESSSVFAIWTKLSFLEVLSSWKMVIPLLAGWIYQKLIGRFYPKYLKDVAKEKKSSHRFRIKLPKLSRKKKRFRFKLPKLSLKRKKSLKKEGRSLGHEEARPKDVIPSLPVSPTPHIVESVPIRRTVALIQEMTKEKGIQWTSTAKEAVYNELQYLYGTWREDELYILARRFVKAIGQDTSIIDPQAVHRTLEKLKKSS